MTSRQYSVCSEDILARGWCGKYSDFSVEEKYLDCAKEKNIFLNVTSKRGPLIHYKTICESVKVIQSQRETKLLHRPNLEILRMVEIDHYQSPSKSPGSEIHGLVLNLENLKVGV